ncbi:MAG: aminotransferase class I/II-fold pyridoxal phosphate-dependent enzyme [Caldilineae bacterium]|nr:MAG: aminotransferase class I/II-fold pyridoxal phosphate-dependent enzyme [Caldilineae bacterium]
MSQPMADRVRHFGTTIFLEMTLLARKHGAVNLGQGSPDFPAPDFVKEAAIAAIRGDVNQYPPGYGQPRLREALARKVEAHYGMHIDPATQIIVTVGATEAIFAAILSLVNPGDEVILFEPYYDSYVPSVQIAGGVPRFYTLRPPDWRIDPDELAALFSAKTRLIVINTPHNPTGKVFSPAELQHIARLCQQYDVIAVTDEVYEHIVFDDHRHVPLATLPGMAERTVTISSAAKTFSVTGWKVGWAIAAPELVEAIFRSKQFISYAGAAPLQEGMGIALDAAGDYYAELAARYRANRDFLLGVLDEVGLKPIVPAGTYFVMADIRHLGFPDSKTFCTWLTTEIGVTAIPPETFYHNPADGTGLARFAFCLRRETLEAAARRLVKLRR